MDVNHTTLAGNLTKDPELKYTPSGSPLCKLRLAVNRTYYKQEGEKRVTKEEVSFIPITVWGKQAEAAGEHLHKGDPIFVEGRVESSQWETEEGEKRSMIGITATRVQFLPRRQKVEGAAEVPEAPMPEVGAAEGE